MKGRRNALVDDVSNPTIEVALEIDSLRTTSDHRHKEEYIRNGIAYLGLRVVETPHFEFLRDFQRDPSLQYDRTNYWRLVDLALRLHRESDGGEYVHNQREVITSATERCNRFIELFGRIKEEGITDSIEVKATHKGRFVIRDGLHRAAIASVLGFRDISARISSLDSELVRLMEELRDCYPEAGRKVLYVPIDHPVFTDWKSLRDSSRWDLIKGEFDWKSKDVLDIGAYTGYFSNVICRMGGNVTGIEIDEVRLDQARRIDRLFDSRTQFVHADLHQFLDRKRFDCILFFSVLHWILKGRGIEGVRDSLSRISSASPVMFMDMGQENEEKMRTQEWTHGRVINRETIPDLVISNSEYRDCDHMGTGDTGRDLFRFSSWAVFANCLLARPRARLSYRVSARELA